MRRGWPGSGGEGRGGLRARGRGGGKDTAGATAARLSFCIA